MDGAGTGTRAGGRGATRAGHGAHGIAQRQISARRLVASSGSECCLRLSGCCFSIVFSLGHGFSFLETALTILVAQTIFQGTYFIGLAARFFFLPHG
jgi:hypothetical protein